MDSDEDGAYGYDMPEDGGPGFSLAAGSKPSHRQGAGGGEDSSADEARDSSDDGNFAYGASAARKRRKRERQSGATDKEKNLYGVFYEDSSDDERGPGARGGKRSQHFDKRSNRQAGLAFVKASSAAPSAEGEKGGMDGENSGDAGGAKTKSDREGAPDEPGWLKDTPRDKSGGAADDDVEIGEKLSNGKQSTANSDEDEEEEALDEEELKLLSDQEQRFKDLLAVATTSKTPLSPAKQSQPRAAVPAAERDNGGLIGGDDGLAWGNDAVGLGLGFGNSRPDEDRSAGPQTATTGLGFAGSSTESKPSMSDNGGAGLGMPAQTGLGHQGGLGLGLKRDPPGQPEQNGGLGLGMGGGMSGMGGLGSNFPSFAQGGIGLGLGHSSQPAKKKDSNLGKWEKHTKGIGS
ncbi:hypothetical protein ACHAXT_003360 [Thalassiosira profunda]